MKKPRHRPAPVSFTAEQVPDEETRRIMQDGLDAMTQSITQLLEFCVAQRMSQFLLVMQEGFARKKLPKTTE